MKKNFNFPIFVPRTKPSRRIYISPSSILSMEKIYQIARCEYGERSNRNLKFNSPRCKVRRSLVWVEFKDSCRAVIISSLPIYVLQSYSGIIARRSLWSWELIRLLTGNIGVYISVLLRRIMKDNFFLPLLFQIE